ncbi:hypothetical protein PMIN06_010319 [Paraphaeosphaeria minitans]|uniref:Uncharacterized protein n=1 Tax=Paraphaeosphaeria minitans TaxID=565426 RepID=A0A9P6KUE3_9PLEO|nr:hypothetical protein PMIN01_04164 [Paraphaeosphaeria minitans]
MNFFTIFTYLSALALALPQTQPANPDLDHRGEGCGYFRNAFTGEWNIWLLPKCANFDDGTYETRITNPKCKACYMFAGDNCSGGLLWVGNNDKQWHWFQNGVKSYYCKTTFP